MPPKHVVIDADKFISTAVWDPNALSEEAELRQGKNLVDAAKATGVKHFVWSTLDHTQDPHVAHWESKAKVDDYLKASGVPRTSYDSPIRCIMISLTNER